ncbi:MAG: alpha/beta fold hydrolase, partial [Paracoccaceae bacterium]
THPPLAKGHDPMRLYPLLAALSLTATQARADSFVLVHGAFQTGTSWQAVADGLKAAGHDAVAVTLPGRAGDGKALAEVTMADYIATVQAAVNDAKAPVHLVGHSFGGIVISATAETVPDRLTTLIYVAAYLPANGQSMQDLASADHHNSFQADTFQIAPDYSFASINPRDRVMAFANDTDATTAQQIADAMVDEPLAPVATPVTLTDSFDALRKAYVVTLSDQTISPGYQMTMIGRGDVDEVVPITSGHSPQITATADLVKALIAVATPELE